MTDPLNLPERETGSAVTAAILLRPREPADHPPEVGRVSRTLLVTQPRPPRGTATDGRAGPGGPRALAELGGRWAGPRLARRRAARPLPQVSAGARREPPRPSRCGGGREPRGGGGEARRREGKGRAAARLLLAAPAVARGCDRRLCWSRGLCSPCWDPRSGGGGGTDACGLGLPQRPREAVGEPGRPRLPFPILPQVGAPRVPRGHGRRPNKGRQFGGEKGPGSREGGS